ncbi:MAG: hypothetical protein GXO30_03340, partial [Epsilonproteobacteria bacterium]|nr:hypothetical protein [Campylobacterota bacterium]
MKIIYLFISIFIFYGCSFSKLSVKKSQNSSDVYDLTHIPQNISSFTNALRDAKELYESQKNY